MPINPFSNPPIAAQTNAQVYYDSPISIDSHWGWSCLTITAFATGIILGMAVTGSQWIALYACGGTMAGLGVSGLLGMGGYKTFHVYRIKMLLNQKCENDPNFVSECVSFFNDPNSEEKEIEDNVSGAKYVLHKMKNGKREIHAHIPEPHTVFDHIWYPIFSSCPNT